MGMKMEFCAEKTIGDSWNCLKEANGELLPIIIFAECLWWLIIMLGMKFGFDSIRKWREKRRMEKRMRQEWKDKWTFPPQRKN
tara:strand:- start:562 stop:810 length:249 start_codon:yes stop_codon:yes gene_type:complete